MSAQLIHVFTLNAQLSGQSHLELNIVLFHHFRQKAVLFTQSCSHRTITHQYICVNIPAGFSVATLHACFV